jgi:tRNA(Ile)-lysidine synthase
VARWPARASAALQGGVLLDARAPSTQAPAQRSPATCHRPVAPRPHAVAGWRGSWCRSGPEAGVDCPLRLREAELRPRRGGERFQLAPGGPPRSLKKQYQARRMPAWDRNGPLLYADGAWLFVPGLGRCPPCGTVRGPLLVWLPDDWRQTLLRIAPLKCF